MRTMAAKIVVCLAVGLAGCVNQQKEVALYRTVLDEGMPATRPVTQTLSLAQALTLANAYYEELEKSGESYVQALIERDRAAWSFLPTVNGTEKYSWQNDPMKGSGHDASSLSVGGSMNLFNGFSDVATLKAAGLTAQQQRLVMLNLRESVFVDIGDVYYQILAAERSRDVLERTIASEQEQLRDSIVRRDQGLATELTVAQNRSQLASTQASLQTALQQIQEGRATLAFLIGQKNVSAALNDDLAAPRELSPMTNLYASGLQHRQDLQAAGFGVDAARQNVRSAVGQYYPSVSVNMEKVLASDPATTNGNLASILSVNVPIFSAGQIEASVRNAWSQYRQVALEQARLKRLVWKDLDIATGKLKSNQLRLVDLQASVDAAAESLRLAEASQRLGKASNLDRLTAQVKLLEAELELTREQIDQKTNYLSLLRSQGLLAEAVKTGQIQ